MTGKQAGLDLATLRALRHLPPSQPLLERIEAHLSAHDGYVAWSGGKDSTAVVHLARQVDPAVPVVWFDSGLEYPEVRTYIETLTDAWALNLTVIPAEPSLLELLAASAVFDMTRASVAVPNLQTVCVQQPAARAHAMFGAGELWGVRADESNGRRIAYLKGLNAAAQECDCCGPDTPRQVARARHGGRIARQNGQVAYGPVWDWDTATVQTYLARHQVPQNPVYAKLARLGAPVHAQRVNALLDFALLEQGRLVWLQRGWPSIFNALASVMPRLRDYT